MYVCTISSFAVLSSHNKIHDTHPRTTETSGIFTTTGRILFKLQQMKRKLWTIEIHCSEFHEWLIHLNRTQGSSVVGIQLPLSSLSIVQIESRSCPYMACNSAHNDFHFREFYGPYRDTLVPDTQNFSNFLKMWVLHCPWVVKWYLLDSRSLSLHSLYAQTRVYRANFLIVIVSWLNV